MGGGVKLLFLVYFLGFMISGENSPSVCVARSDVAVSSSEKKEFRKAEFKGVNEFLRSSTSSLVSRVWFRII